VRRKGGAKFLDLSYTLLRAGKSGFDMRCWRRASPIACVARI